MKRSLVLAFFAALLSVPAWAQQSSLEQAGERFRSSMPDIITHYKDGTCRDECMTEAVRAAKEKAETQTQHTEKSGMIDDFVDSDDPPAYQSMIGMEGSIVIDHPSMSSAVPDGLKQQARTCDLSCWKGTCAPFSVTELPCTTETTECIVVRLKGDPILVWNEVDIVALDRSCPAETTEFVNADLPQAKFRVCTKAPKQN